MDWPYNRFFFIWFLLSLAHHWICHNIHAIWIRLVFYYVKKRFIHPRISTPIFCLYLSCRSPMARASHHVYYNYSVKRRDYWNAHFFKNASMFKIIKAQDSSIFYKQIMILAFKLGIRYFLYSNAVASFLYEELIIIKKIITEFKLNIVLKETRIESPKNSIY